MNRICLLFLQILEYSSRYQTYIVKSENSTDFIFISSLETNRAKMLHLYAPCYFYLAFIFASTYAFIPHPLVARGALSRHSEHRYFYSASNLFDESQYLS
jgi:hypothetical protein